MFEKTKNAISAAVSPVREHWSGLRADLRERVRGFRGNRESEAQAPLTVDFGQVLDAWGMEEADIPLVLRDLRLRCLILLCPVCVAVTGAIIAPAFLTLLCLALVALSCLFGVLITLWRISVLKNRSFRSFLRWLSGLGRGRA